MNHIYQLAFNRSRDIVQVTSEIVRGSGKRQTPRPNRRRRRTPSPIVLAIALTFGAIT